MKIPAATVTTLGRTYLVVLYGADGILARNLTEEQKIIDNLFQDFVYDPIQGRIVPKMRRKLSNL